MGDPLHPPPRTNSYGTPLCQAQRADGSECPNRAVIVDNQVQLCSVHGFELYRRRERSRARLTGPGSADSPEPNARRTNPGGQFVDGPEFPGVRLFPKSSDGPEFPGVRLFPKADGFVEDEFPIVPSVPGTDVRRIVRRRFGETVRRRVARGGERDGT